MFFLLLLLLNILDHVDSCFDLINIDKCRIELMEVTPYTSSKTNKLSC